MADPQIDDVYDNVTSLSASPDGKQVAFGSIDGTLTLWDIDRRRRICPPIMAHQSIINSVCYSGDGLSIASASDDQTVGLWDATTGQSLRNTYTGHDHGVLIVGFMTDARTVVSLSRDRIVLVWQAMTGEVGQKFRIFLDARCLATLSNDGERLLAAHRRGITLWNTITTEPIRTIALEGAATLCMGLSQDTTKVALGMADNSISLWDLERGEVDSPHLEGGKELPLYVVWSPDGRTISSVAQDAALRVWSVDSRQCMSKSHRTMGPITYSPSSNFIVCPGNDGSPDVWEFPQMPRHSSVFSLDSPANAASMHRTPGPTESDDFWNVSGDQQVPVASGQSARRPRNPEDLPDRNTPSKTRGFFSRTIHRLSTRGKNSDKIAPAKYKNPVAVAPVTRRGMSQSRHITTTHPTDPDCISEDSEDRSRSMSIKSSGRGCLLCRMG